MLKVTIDDQTKGDLDEHERQLLKQGDAGGSRRVRIIIMSTNGFSVQDIAIALSVSKQTVRRAIHAYCRHGVNALATKPRSGAPAKLTKPVVDTIECLVRQAPRNLANGKPEYESNTWTIRMLTQYLQEYHHLQLSTATVHKALCLLKMRFGRPKHTITSPDPDYADKRDYIDNLVSILVSPDNRVDQQLKKN